MKRIMTIIIIFLLLFMTVKPVMTSAAGTVNIKLSASSSTVRPDDTVTITVSMSGVSAAGGVASGQVRITYDTSKLTYQSASIGGGKPAADLDANASGNTVILVYLDNKGGSGGYSSDAALATVKFKVKNVSPGTASFSVAAEGFGDKNAAGISAKVSGTSVAIAAPRSSNNKLASMTVSNATISPAFNKDVTSYTAEVPFSVSKLALSAKAEDAKATVSQNNPTLTPDGTTNVTVTVTAENGSKRTYTIKVKRAKDPNYVPGSNNALSSIKVDGFLLSPVFKADVTNYVVWLPYETEEIKVSGKASDSKASVQVEGGKNLAAGQDNPVKVICVAENGERKEYTIIAKRAAAHDGSVDSTPAPTPGQTPEGTDIRQPTAPGATQAAGQNTTNGIITPGETDTESGGMQWWVIILLFLGLGAVAMVGVSYIMKRRQAMREREEQDDNGEFIDEEYHDDWFNFN